MPQVSGSYSNKYEKWLRKTKVRLNKFKILCILDELSIKKNLSNIDLFVHLSIKISLIAFRNADLQIALLSQLSTNH